MRTDQLQKRAAATQATIDRFLGKPLRWGVNDCVRMARFHLGRMDIHPEILKGVRYRSERGAILALRGTDCPDLQAAVDASGLAPIPAAMAWTGDLVALPAPDPWGVALFVSVGNGRLLGLHQERFCILQPAEFTSAWRVIDNG